MDFVNKYLMRVQEYNVIGSAVRLNEIPPQFRKLPMIGRGATTIAFEKDPKTVLIFTRDGIKKDWLMHGLHMVTQSEIVEPVRSHHIKGMSDIALWAITMPKLFPLSTENKRKVTKEIKDWIDLSTKVRTKSLDRNYKLDKFKYISTLSNLYQDQYPDSILAPLFDFLINYDPHQYVLDIGNRQFKQTADGKIVLLDPIVDQELMDLFMNHRKSKGNLYYNDQ